MRNGNGTEKFDEQMRGMQKTNGKERATAEEKIELHVCYVLGRAGGGRVKEISWPSSCIGTASCTAYILRYRTGGPPKREGHQLAVVAYRDGQLYCMCTKA